ncbi:MAG TPA: hypothetical protein VLB82_02880 [Thermodesulfobacteriota bacterium]|nr:hypothetical protein [Thermodesulfobacteriota bacterium]
MSNDWYKDKTLKQVIENTHAFESYPSCILDHDKQYEGKQGAIKAIGDAMAILQSIGRGKEDMEDFYEHVDKNDIWHMAMFLSEKTWMFNRMKEDDNL